MKKRIISTLLALNLCLSGVTALAKPAEEVAAEDYKETFIYLKDDINKVSPIQKPIASFIAQCWRDGAVIDTVQSYSGENINLLDTTTLYCQPGDTVTFADQSCDPEGHNIIKWDWQYYGHIGSSYEKYDYNIVNEAQYTFNEVGETTFYLAVMNDADVDPDGCEPWSQNGEYQTVGHDYGFDDGLYWYFVGVKVIVQEPEKETPTKITVNCIDRSTGVLMSSEVADAGAINSENPVVSYKVTVPEFTGYEFEDWRIILPDGTIDQKGETSEVEVGFTEEYPQKVVEIGYQPIITTTDKGTPSRPDKISDCNQTSIRWTENESHTYTYYVNGQARTGTCTHTYKYKATLDNVSAEVSPDTLKSGYGFSVSADAEISDTVMTSCKASRGSCGKLNKRRKAQVQVTPPTNADVYLGYEVSNRLGSQGKVISLDNTSSSEVSAHFETAKNPISVIGSKEIFTDIWLAGTKEYPVKHYLTVKFSGGGVNGTPWCTTIQKKFTINGDMYEDDGTTDGV